MVGAVQHIEPLFPSPVMHLPVREREARVEDRVGRDNGGRLTARQRDHPDWVGGLSPAKYVYRRIQASIPAGQQMPLLPNSREVLMFFQLSPDPPVVPALPAVSVGNAVIDPQLLLQRAAPQEERIVEAQSDSSSDSESDDEDWFRAPLRGLNEQLNYAIPAIPADYPRPTYPRAASPTPSIAVIDEMELPEIAPRVTKPLPKGKSHAKVAKPKIAMADGSIVAIEWQCPNNGHNKRLGYGVEQPCGKVSWTAYDLMQNVYIDPDQHIGAFWEKRANDYRTLGRIRVHLAMNSHQLGSAINRAMAKRLRQAEQNAIAVLLDSIAVLWYNPGITIKDAMLVSDEYIVSDAMV
ncbi:hypothetical protein QFC20_006413 [Naganishia adeliensis]|uniref:Uncharacterized protein n=1 Tax=Naganishia adeliensis TaxID=92952 RepID=A0ACC2VCA3_9TREE|nr:hypothetical protein QFC20_006413 [Naganishia adeliensis]